MKNTIAVRSVLSISRKPKKSASLGEPTPPVEVPPPVAQRARKKHKSKAFRRWQKKRHQRYRSKTCLTRLRSLWPALFDTGEIIPLVTGIHSALLEDWMERFPQEDAKEGRSSFLKQALGYYTHRPVYLFALARCGSCRHDIRGTISLPVTSQHRDSARRKLLENIQNDSVKKQALLSYLSMQNNPATMHVSIPDVAELSDSSIDEIFLRCISLLTLWYLPK